MANDEIKDLVFTDEELVNLIKDPDKTKANLARNARILMRMVDFMLADLPDGESRRVAVSYLSLVALKMIGAFDVDPPASV